MKVKDLLNEGMKGYGPRYDDDQKIMFGAVSDWLEKMGVSKADLATAVAKIKKDPLMKELADAGLQYVEKPASEKRGTLTFKVKRTHPGQEVVGGKWVKVAGKDKSYDTFYQVYANGQIRHGGSSNFYANRPQDKVTGDSTIHSQTRLQSPKPRLKAGDPVESLLMIYKNSLSEVLRKWNKAKASMEKQLKKVNAG